MESTDDVACQLLLSLSSRISDESTPPRKSMRKRRRPSSDGAEFECKTCNKRFPSFQALGGHRTGHKRAKIIHQLLEGHRKNTNYGLHDQKPARNSKKQHLHQCTICGEGFSMGQALGGHMRRHRADPIGAADSDLNMPLPSLEECGRRSGEISGIPRNSSHIRLLELFV